MPVWKLTCPSCGTENQASKELVVVKCGKVTCTCTCVNCSQEFSGEEDWWRWAGLTEGPPPKKQV